MSGGENANDLDDSEISYTPSSYSVEAREDDGHSLTADSEASQSHYESKSLPASTKRHQSNAKKHKDTSSDDEPLIDKTAALALHSKKLARLQKKQQKKESKKVRSDVKSFLDFPHEILSLVLSFCEVSDIFNLMLVNRSTKDLISDNERSIADAIIARRYWVLSQCFQRPIRLDDVPREALPALLSRHWQERLRIHKNPYQHIKQINPVEVCTCMSCVLAWNNLNIILDLAHWQDNFDRRDPLPIIKRGSYPDWNTTMLANHAAVVSKAIRSPLTWARILQIHLKTTTRTIIRSSRFRTRVLNPRLYQLSDRDASAGTDEYLERSGPPSYQPLFMRDNYYSVEAFVPNRKWDKERQRWMYYSNWPKPHENDLTWVMQRFTPSWALPDSKPEFLTLQPEFDNERPLGELVAYLVSKQQSLP
jgi:hypothetical protein